jgi:predicted molibdopterin-dependent oxidoreductase YjgC
VARATITDRVPPNTAFMTFHYHESPVNELTNSAYDPVTKTAEFKVTAVRIEKLVPCAVPEEAAALEACP